MDFRALPRSLLFLLVLGVVASRADGQAIAIAGAVNQVLFPGEGIGRSCLERGYTTGLGVRVGRPVISRVTGVELTGRGYVLARRSTCVDGFPPPDGVYIEDDRKNLLAASFASTDVRFRARSSSSRQAPGLAVGLGYTWRARHNLPYALLDLQLPLAPLKAGRLSLEGELFYARVASDRFRRTYQNFQVIAEESLGRHYQWSGAVSVALVAQVELR